MTKIIRTHTAPQAIGPYSQAVESGNILFVSGQIPLNPETGEIEGSSVSEQTERVILNILAILEAAGYTLKNVVKTTCILSDMKDFQEMNTMYNKYFGDVLPARSTYAVKDLPKGARIEIESVAIK